MKSCTTSIVVTLAILALLQLGVDAGASNSLSDCMAVARAFNNTCDINNGPIVLSTHVGTTVTCTNLPAANCPGTLTGGVCTFQHKLCVTCTCFFLFAAFSRHLTEL